MQKNIVPVGDILGISTSLLAAIAILEGALAEYYEQPFQIYPNLIGQSMHVVSRGCIGCGDRNQLPPQRNSKFCSDL